jgi:hypothetical protein
MENSFLYNWQWLWFGFPLYIEEFSRVPNIALVESSTSTAF